MANFGKNHMFEEHDRIVLLCVIMFFWPSQWNYAETLGLENPRV